MIFTQKKLKRVITNKMVAFGISISTGQPKRVFLPNFNAQHANG